MKRGIILSALILAITATAGFAGSQSKETRDLKDFTKISYGVSGNLYITFGSEFKVVLEGERRDIEEIITEVSGDRLIIKKDNWRFNLHERVNVYVTLPELEGLGVSGSGNAEIKDALRTDNLNLSVSGSGKIYTTDITVTTFDCSISGSGNIILGGSGSASKAEIGISGSGNYSGEPLKIGSAEIHISGSGNCRCNVTESLRASVSGSGNVTYDGNPKIDAHVSGSGKIRSL